MSIFFGKINVETPKFTLLKKTPSYEIRRYAPQIRAQISYSSSELSSSYGFRPLANYIFGQNVMPESKTSEKMAMTAPVLTESDTQAGKSQKMAMTAPVTTEQKDDRMTMAFILPSKYERLDQLPRPLNPAVKLVEIPAKTMAVHEFTGWADESTVGDKHKFLRAELEKDPEVEVVKDAEPSLARYNPPWTIPFLRTNEVLLQVEWKGGREE